MAELISSFPRRKAVCPEMTSSKNPQQKGMQGIDRWEGQRECGGRDRAWCDCTGVHIRLCRSSPAQGHPRIGRSSGKRTRRETEAPGVEREVLGYEKFIKIIPGKGEGREGRPQLSFIPHNSLFGQYQLAQPY